jgi:sulfotransferase
MSQYYFISGLPRSGTTLLSTILNQNPKFQASISGPLARFTRATIEQSSSMVGYETECPPEKRKNIINGIFQNYYDDKTKDVFFDTNRGWGLMLPLLSYLFPYTKVIMCVRDITWVLDSFERLYRKNPYSTSKIIPSDRSGTVYSRCNYLMQDSSVVGFAYNSLKQAITSVEKNMLMLIEYEQLCKNPQGMVQAIYNFIDQPQYDHNFNNVAASYPEYDADVGIEGMHTTRAKVEWTEREMIIPPDIQHQFSNMEVWR